MTDPRPDPVATLARTIWGEARGCGGPGMRHIASVVLNRADHPTWWGRSITGVCLQPWQFSCWNADDPNYPKLLVVTEHDPAFAVAMQIAHRAVSGMLPDETHGADSYFALSMKTPPPWAAKAKRVAVDGWHAFYVTNPDAPPGTKPDIRNVGFHAPPPESAADALMAAELASLNPPTE